MLAEIATYSGELGSPMLSNFGARYIGHFPEFNTMPKIEDNRFNHDFGDFDITKIPEELLKE